MKVVVEKIARHKKGFLSDSVWYNFFQGGKPSELPANIVEGGTITLQAYEETPTGNIDFTHYAAAKGSAPAAKKAGGGYSKGKGEDPDIQRLIVRQNALTNACVLTAAAGGTPKEAIEIMEQFAAAVLGGGAPVAKTAAKKPTTRRKKAAPVDEDPYKDRDYEDMDDED